MTKELAEQPVQDGIAGKIPRPDISVAQIVLLILSQTGKATFQQIRTHPNVRLLAAERSENSFYTALARLKRRRSINRTADHQYELTPTGEYAALKAFVRKELSSSEKKNKTDNLKISSSAKWDGKWRIVLFDIPESRRPVRDYLRNVLKRHGFTELQRSFWVWPHRLPLYMVKMFSDPQLRRHVRVVTTHSIDYDEDLRKRFKLL